MSGLLLVCAIAFLVRQVGRKAVCQSAGLSVLKGPAGQSLLLLGFYGIAVLILGYPMASAIFFVLAQRAFGERSWARSAGFGLVITGSLYFVFSYLAGVPFP